MTNLEQIANPVHGTSDPVDIEIRLLIECIYDKYGYDFSDYAQASLKRNILKIAAKHNCSSVADVLHRILSDSSFFKVNLFCQNKKRDSLMAISLFTQGSISI